MAGDTGKTKWHFEPLAHENSLEFSKTQEFWLNAIANAFRVSNELLSLKSVDTKAKESQLNVAKKG